MGDGQQRSLGDKTRLVLQIAAHPVASEARTVLYQTACAMYSEKAVCKKFDDLCDKGYIECGVSARTGWLTDKGREALDA